MAYMSPSSLAVVVCRSPVPNSRMPVSVQETGWPDCMSFENGYSSLPLSLPSQVFSS